MAASWLPVTLGSAVRNDWECRGSTAWVGVTC